MPLPDLINEETEKSTSNNQHSVEKEGNFYRCTVCGKKATKGSKLKLTACNNGSD